MPRLQYVTVREDDLGAGIDQQSAENKIAPGFTEDLENADPKSTGQVAKRTGYQGYAGYLPVRVNRVEYNGTQIDFILDSSIELPIGQSSPLIVLGKTSEASGDFAAETIEYYSGFTADIRKSFSTGAGTISLPATEHGFSTELLFVGTTRSTTTDDNSHEHILADSVSIDKTTKDITVGYTNNTGSVFSGFLFAKDKSADPGTTYVSTGNVVAVGDNNFSILGATHNLDNNNIIVEVYKDTGTDLERVQPEAVTLDDSTGNITIDINNVASGFTATFILTAAPTANFATGSVAPTSTQSITIDTSVTGATDFAFISCYLEPTIGGILEQVIPDSITADSTAQTITVTFTNNKVTGANFEIYWDFATVVTNQLSVTGTNSASFVDTAPQLTIWGLCHEEIYGDRIAREGWVNHIDSYRAPAESRLISGLGGNLFAARLREEGSNDTDFLMPALYPDLNARISSDTIIGPAFYDAGETPGRTRGFITGDNGGNNFFEITSIAYNSGTGNVDYTLTIPSLSINGTLSTIISTTAGLEDRFTAQQCGYAAHNGTFVIKAVSNPDATTLVISIENSTIDSSDFDETDVGGEGGVFTDRLVFTATSPFLSGDKLDSDLFDATTDFTAVASSTTTVLMEGVTDTLSLPGGLRIIAARTSDIVPLRDIDGAATVENLVRGDQLVYTGIARQFRIKSINQLTDTSVSITGDGTTATVTLGSGDTTSLFVGKKVLISGTSNYNGAIEITEVTTSTAFTFDSSLTTTEAGTMVGKTIHLDESFEYTDTLDDSVTFSVFARWIPIESPTDNFDLTPKTRVSYFDTSTYSAQSIIRSTTVQDNLYLTNDDDEVMKFDGTNIYRAGLFRWQPNLFVTTDTTATGKVVMDNPSVNFSAIATNQFTVTSGDEQTFVEGDIIETSTDGETYTVISVETAGKVVVNRTISGAGSGTITRTRAFKYYFRLNAVDANDNIVASAVTGSDDFVVRLGADAAVNIKLVGMPVMDIYDYDRLEVQIYRTQGDQVAPFYRLTTIALSFNEDDGYIEYTDTDSDEDLRDLDEVNTALKGAELGTAWGQPLRAKYCTSAGNRLILGNLKDYPTLDLRILKNSGILTQSVFTDADNRTWTFRKDNTDLGTSSDMVNRAVYQFTSSNVTVSGITGTAGTSFSVAATGHGFTSAGQWVYLYHDAVADSNQLTYSGWWQVASVTDANNFVINSANATAGAATNFPNRAAFTSTREAVPVFIGTDGNYSMVNGNRTSTEPYEFLAMRRMADAINTSMRKTDTTLTGFENFEPWMTASAGNEFNTGQLIVKQPRIFSTTLEVLLPVLSSDFDVFVNNLRRTGTTQVSALTRLFPSRIIASYQNYPEIFDNPTAVLETESDSVIDINSADGQEITAIIPFFGDAAFGAAQKSGIVVVFKTNSIYLVDLAAKDAGQNAVQRLETRGKGCTAPFSVSVTRGGIMFANDTGIYRLSRDLRVEYIGRKYERKFKETVNRSQLAIATGHHDTESNSYKLSYPVGTAIENSHIAVYNHTREYEGTTGDGSWTTYTNHPVTGWSNLDADSYFASTEGRVFIVRKLGEASDYRDDDQAVAMTVLTRAMDMLESGRRKVFSKIITHYRTVSQSSGTELKAALDLNTVFQDTDAFVIAENTDSTGTGDTGTKKVITIASVMDEKVGVYLQLRYTNSTLDEAVEITGIDIRVAAKSSEGITEAAET